VFDPLPERQRIVSEANQLASQPPSCAHIGSIGQSGDGLLRLAIGGGRVIVADEVIGLTGYRPDLSFLSDFRVAESFLKKVSTYGLQVVTEQIAQPEALFRLQILFAFEQEPARLLQHDTPPSLAMRRDSPARISSSALFISATM
jgi:hypothetical protein